MIHDEFIKKSLWPYVKNILKIFKDDIELQKRIRIMYRDEAHKLLEFNPTNKLVQHTKYISIIETFKQFANENIKKKELEYLTMVKSPKTKRSKTKENSPKSKRSKTNNKPKQNFTKILKEKTNLHKLLQKNWNNMLK